MKTLHIIRSPKDILSLEAVDFEKESNKVGILLIQDGVLSRIDLTVEIYACEEDVRARSVETGYKLIDYDGICGLILEYERAIVW